MTRSIPSEYAGRMKAMTIDPRDQTSEFDAPTYRVFFWDEKGRSDEWELCEADLDEVLDWIGSQSAGRSHSLWVVTGEGNKVTHTRLRGMDPPAPRSTWPAWAQETRA